jgi:hypothetical protein
MMDAVPATICDGGRAIRREPSVIKTDFFTLTKAHFETIVKATDT